jgi:transcriptional regulator with XRE-family HTH domain
MMIDYKLFKHKLIEYDLNANEIANKLNISANTVRRWLRGENLEQIEKFICLLELLKIDIKDIKKKE